MYLINHKKEFKKIIIMKWVEDMRLNFLME